MFILHNCKYSQFNYFKMRRDMPDTRFKKVYTFNSARKSMSTIIPLDSGGFRWQSLSLSLSSFSYSFSLSWLTWSRVYTKGASEIVMKKCSFLLAENGRVDSFTAQHQDRFKHQPPCLCHYWALMVNSAILLKLYSVIFPPLQTGQDSDWANGKRRFENDQLGVQGLCAHQGREEPGKDTIVVVTYSHVT